jgi:SAM-dependent methyltransferase
MLGLYVTDLYPGFGKEMPLMHAIVKHLGARAIADVGGGAHPMLAPEKLAELNLDCTLFDISQTELDKAATTYKKKQVDMCLDPASFAAAVPGGQFDIAVSHDFLEHVQSPSRIHANIRHLLRPGGIAVHMFPSPSNIPLALNHALPEWLSSWLVRMTHPERDLDGFEGKFPAYYQLCGIPRDRTKQIFESFGYKILQYDGFIGHSYYYNIPLLRQFEEFVRPVLAKLRIPLISNVLLILLKV